MKSFVQMFQYASFLLAEYARSGRILIELLACAGCAVVFFRPDNLPPTPEYFFSISATFALVLCFYSASAFMALADRPQTYTLLTHGLSRTSYLLGMFLASTGVVAAAYGILSLIVAVINPIGGLDVRDWLLGTLPLLLNVALLAAMLLLLAPMVLTNGWRLLILALVALAFSGSLIGGTTMASMPVPLATVLSVLRTILGAPLLPAFSGFALSVTRDYSGISAIVPLAQAMLLLSLLGLTIAIFLRRELVFGRSA